MSSRLFIHDGSAYADLTLYLRLPPEKALEVTERADETAPGSSTFELDDPLGELNLLGLRPAYIEEDSAVAPYRRTWTGYLAGRVVSRGEVYRVGASRVWSVEVVDLNSYVSRRLLTNTVDANRSAETDIERLDWLLSTWQVVNIGNETLIDPTGPVAMDAVDYRGQPADAVLGDLRRASGKNSFLYWDEAGGTFGIWYAHDDFPAYSATLSLSNVFGVWDRVSCFPISLDTSLSMDPSRTISGARLEYDGGVWFERDGDQAAAIGGARELPFSEPFVKSAAKAEARALLLLSQNATEEHIITCGVPDVPEALVNRIKCGQRVLFQASHLPGCEDFAYKRIIQRTVKQASESSYDLTLELTTGGQAFPVTACLATAALTQSSGMEYGNATNSIPSPACLQVWVETGRFTPYSMPNVPTGFTLAEWCSTSLGAGNNGTTHIAYRISEAGDIGDADSLNTGGDRAHVLYEFSGVNGLQDAAAIDDQPSASPMVSPAVTPTGTRALVVAVFMKSFAGPMGGNTLPDMDIVAPATQLDWTGTLASNDQGPTMVIGYRFIDNPSGSYTISATADTASFANGEWGCVIAAFGIDGSVSSGVPSVPPAIPTGGGGGGTGGTLVAATPGALAAAVAAAADGDTLTLRGGTHLLAGIISTSKSLRFQNYTGESPVITWGASTRNDGLYFTGGVATISGITFQASAAITHDANGSAQVELDGGDGLVLIGCTFIGHANYDDHQQLVYQRLGTNIIVQECTFIANGSEGFGFHQYPGSSSDPNCLVTDCSFDGFQVSGGVTSDSRIRVEGSTFTNNNIGVQLRNDADGSIIQGNSGSPNSDPLQIGGGVSGVTDIGNTWS